MSHRLSAIAVLGVAAAALTVCGCSAGSPARSMPASHPATSLSAAPQPAASSSTAPAGAAPSGTTLASAGVRNLPASAALRSELTATYAKSKGIPLSDVTGPRPGTVYYAYDPATGRYWAMATFSPSATASLQVQVSFQDGAATGMFTKTGNGGWHLQLAMEPAVCAYLRFFPKSVLKVWSLPQNTAGLGC